MAKALTKAQANAIIPDAERENALKQERIEARENEALDELRKLGFRVTLHTMGRYVSGDDLLGIEAGFKRGDCYAVQYGRDGKRKHVSGSSAVEALQQAQAWSKWQAGLKDDAAAKFHPSVDGNESPLTVIQRIAGDTAQTAARRSATERRILSFASGSAEIVDAHGTPIEQENTSR